MNAANACHLSLQAHSSAVLLDSHIILWETVTFTLRFIVIAQYTSYCVMSVLIFTFK